MNYAKIIHEAWGIVTNTRKLKWLCFFPSFAAVVVFVAEIVWQGGMLASEFGIVEHSFLFKEIGKGLSFLAVHHLITWTFFLLVFVLLFQFVLPSWISSSLILGIQQKLNNPEKYLSARQIVRNGFHYFPKLVELHAILAPFALLSISFYSVTLYRFYHGDIFSHIFKPILVVFFIASLFINLFTMFSPYYVVCENLSVFASIRKSIGLVFMNLGHTITLILLMLLVNVRVIINVLVVLGIPLGLFFTLSFWAKSSWLVVAIISIAVLGAFLLALSAYFTAILEVFSMAVWTKSFQLLQIKEKNMIDSGK